MKTSQLPSGKEQTYERAERRDAEARQPFNQCTEVDLDLRQLGTWYIAERSQTSCVQPKAPWQIDTPVSDF